ncbi:ferritin-like domain-containing protein [Mesonia aquimarina]|uniref:ferritin-like domain-containing protein n=1 Tax=Mesonia aquimarina TaxID=1504967 RepID=UPI000EF5CE5A|nr:ferritin-like domain-containing protein [Mesonia aquimarina]
MSIIKFLDEFTSDNLKDRGSSRRDALNTFSSLGKKAAMAAVPFGLGAVSQKARATTTAFQNDSITDALQLALTLEYLEAEFYNKALDSGVLPTGKPEQIYMQIAKHENAHVTLLQTALGSSSIPSPEFDFTAGGLFDPFNEDGTGQETAYGQLLALAQAFEDTGVRAYKGQAGNVMSNPDVLTTALQIHSVEARHASEIRRLRSLDGWITLNERGDNMPSQTQAVYNGEENLIQGGVDVSTLGSGDPFTAAASSQAYDEILTGQEASDIAGLFIVQ